MPEFIQVIVSFLLIDSPWLQFTLWTLGSVFARSTYKPPANATSVMTIFSPTDVTFKRIECIVDPLAYTTKFVAAVGSGAVFKGRLDDQAFAHGGMKAAFDVSTNPFESFHCAHFYVSSSK